MENDGSLILVTLNALIKRINRKLAHEYQVLRKSRSWCSDLGDYYVVDVYMNYVVAAHIEPETLGRELRVLQSWENGIWQ